MASRKRRGSGVALWLGPVLALAVAAAILLFDQDTGLMRLIRLLEEEERARARVVALVQEEARLRTQIRRLRSEPLAIETVAREQLGMARPGELVLRWSDAGGTD